MFAVPAPALATGVFVPYAVVLPYSKYQVVAVPFGLTVPLRVAVVALSAVTGPVIAAGAVAACATAATASSSTAARPAGAILRTMLPTVRIALIGVPGGREEDAKKPKRLGVLELAEG